MIKHLYAAVAAILVVSLVQSSATVYAMGGPDPAEQLSDAVDAVKAKKYRVAIGLLDEVLDNDSQNADALNYLGFSYRKLGKLDQAVGYYKQALAVDPDHRGAHEYIGEAYLETNRPARAERHLAQLASICGPGCEEYRELREAFDAYKARHRPQQSSVRQ